MATLLTKSSFEDYLRDQRLKALPVDGIEGAKILIDPLNMRVVLEVTCSSIPDLTLSERLSWTTLSQHEDAFHGELSVWAGQQMFEAYLLVADIAAELSEIGDMQAALEAATSGFSELLETDHILSQEKQIGLAGELVVIKNLLDLGKGHAVDFWMGPDGSEHDFKFREFDLEVKTTVSERRSHRIGNLSQLTPSRNRPLFLASIQLTRTTNQLGFNLSELIKTVQMTGLSGQDKFFEKLERSGWKREHAHLYSSRFELRSEALVFEVDSNFPRLDAENLNLAENLGSRISDVSYRVELDGLASAETLNETLKRAKLVS